MEDKLKVYVSGKISGLQPAVYTAKFNRAVERIKENYEWVAIFNPCDITPLFGIKKYWFFMIADLYVLIFKCNSIYLLDNWKDSRGAKIELFIALLLNKKIL